MKLIVKIILVVFVCLMVTKGYAQKVVVDKGRFIIDASGIEHTTTKKARGTDGTNDTWGTQSIDYISSWVSNEKVYYKFEVSAVDEAQDVTWKEAVDACEKSTRDGGDWRLPTQRELMLISVLLPELKQVGCLFSNSFYWAATEYINFPYQTANSMSWGKASGMSKDVNATVRARCIRELD